MKKRITPIRLILAGAIGGTGSVIYTWYGSLTGWGSRFHTLCQGVLSTVIFDFLFCLLMACVAFRIEKMAELIQYAVILHGAAAFTAGVFLLLNDIKPLNNWLAAGLTLCVTLLIWITFVRQKHDQIKNQIYELTLLFGDEKVLLPVLYDTGNDLYEPMGGRPVTIIEYGAIRLSLNEYRNKRMKIPYRTVGVEHGTLEAVIADTAYICNGNKHWEYKEAVIALYPGKFHKQGRYRGILHPDMLTKAQNSYVKYYQ